MVEFKEYVIYIFKENKIKSLIVFVLTLVVTTLSLLEPQLLVILVDKAISHDNFNLLFIVSISYVILIVISALCKYSITVLRTKIKKQTTYKMRTKLLLHIQELPGKYFTEQKTGDILKVIDSDVSALEETGIDFVIDIIKNLLSAISAFVILACINTKLLLIMILMETFMLFLHEKYIKLVSKKLERVRDISGKSMNLLEEFVVHMMDIIITHANILFLKKYLNNEQLYINESTKLEKMIEKNQLTANTLNEIMFIVIYLISGLSIIQNTMTIGTMMAFIQYTSMLISPILQLTNSNTRIHIAIVSLRRIRTVLRIPKTVDVETKENIEGKIQFENVNFSYQPEVNVLNDFNMKIEKGKKIAIVGCSGCGKSTLLKLLYRLWSPNQGKILIDDIPIEKYSLKALRDSIAIVTQDVMIFNDTVLNNINLTGDRNISEIKKMCKKIDLEDNAILMDENPEGTVGEYGVKLSGGQKQRIAILRAILQNASIYVFDEATSALDNLTQEKIMEEIDTYLCGKTTIIIAHRLSTVRNADYIYVIENGSVVEEGTHDKLMLKNGAYKKMYMSEI